MCKMVTLGTNLAGWISAQFTEDFDVSRPENAQITFPDFTSTQAGLGGDVRIYRDQDVAWRGMGVSVSATFDAQNRRQYVLNCLSNKVYLDREAFSKVINGAQKYSVTYGGGYTTSTNIYANGAVQASKATSIFYDIINAQTAPQKLSIGQLGSNDPTINVPHVAGLVAARVNCLTLLQQLIAGSVWETRFNPDNSVDYLPTVGTTTPNFIIDEGRNTENFEYDEDITKMCNYAIVCGGGTASGSGTSNVDNQILGVSENASSIAKYGAWTIVKNLPNVTDPNLLQAYANALVADLGEPVPTVKCRVVDFKRGVNFREGDTVQVNSPSFQLYGQNFRIIEIKRSYEAKSNGETIDLVLVQNLRQCNILQFELDEVDAQARQAAQSHKVSVNTLNPAVPVAATYYPADGFYWISASGGNPQAPAGNGYLTPLISSGSQTYHWYLSLGITGLFKSWQIQLNVNTYSPTNGVGTLSNLGVNDLTAGGNPLLLVASPTQNNWYIIPTASNDVSDHVFDFYCTLTYSSGTSVQMQLWPFLGFTPPQVPT